jgi:nitroreductase
VTLGLSTDELLTTTRSVRKRLDLSRPVDRSVLVECLDLALQAPNGSNRQGWHWVFVTDGERKRAIAGVYRRNLASLMTAAAPSPMGAPRGSHQERNMESGRFLAEHLHEVPVMLIPCINGRLEGASVAAGASSWGSLLPAVWSFMLALRSRGLGSAWTTVHLRDGGEADVAHIVGIPVDAVTQAGLFPIAYTVGTTFHRAERLPVDEVVHWDTW